MTETEFNGMFPFFEGIEMIETKKVYYFKLLKHIFDGKYHLEKVLLCYCGSTDLELLSIQDRFALPFGSKICKTCGLIQQSPRLSEKDLPEFYDEIYWGLILGNNDDELSTGDKEMARTIHNFLLKNIDTSIKKKEISIIEIGCGSGVKLEEIKKQFEASNIKCRVIGCDYSHKAVDMAKKKNIKAMRGGIDSLSGQKADIVILSHVVEHFSNIRNDFDKIKKLLNPKAYIYIEVPGVCDLLNKSEYNYDYLIYSVMAHINNFNLTSLRSVVEPMGFRFIIGDEFVRSLFQFDPSGKSNVDFSNNYEYTLSYLRRVEEKRKKNPFFARAKRKASNLLHNYLNFLFLL